VRVIDSSTLQVIGEPIKTGAAPAQMTLSPDGRDLYLVNMYTNDVTEIDVETDHTRQSGTVGNTPRGIAVMTL
jgi:YVTN family beta-propeller protein